MAANLGRSSVFASIFALAAGTAMLGPFVRAIPVHAESVILVDTLIQKIDGVGGCSLQEAIYAANLDASIAPKPDAPGQFIATTCAAGSGADVIELSSGLYSMSSIIDDEHNEIGPAATPMITSTIVIEGRGAKLAHVGPTAFRAFAVGTIGNLDLREVHIVGFSAKGGDGGWGAGGGLGAGGAIYVHDGSLTVQWSTFENNGAIGGNGNGGANFEHEVLAGSGGGGLSGNGGEAGFGQGGGGGGARGDGEAPGSGFDGGGGGGTMTAGRNGNGGFRCGGDGGRNETFGLDGATAGCAGGGGGGGTVGDGLSFGNRSGGCGAYGGGGGGGGISGNGSSGDGGDGGFGGGGGGGEHSSSGGDGGFGGGAGYGQGGTYFGGSGVAGSFAGDATPDIRPVVGGGGGAALGGAIFGHSATIVVSNSTFTTNYAVRGVAGGDGATNGQDAGGAIFTVGGSLKVVNATISGNETTGDGGGLVVYQPTTGERTSLALQNTIISGNGSRDECFVLRDVTQTNSTNFITSHAEDVRSNCEAITHDGDPRLSPLQMNAPGRTPTMAIATNSLALNGGDRWLAPLDDQRGVSRPQLSGVDIGAYEREADTVPVDKNAPTAAVAQDLPANVNGWYNTAVKIAWNWGDVDGSGIDPTACTTETTSTGEGASMTLSATCADLAGNVARASTTVNVDLTAPTVTCGPTPNFTVGGAHDANVSATVSDALSGPEASPLTADVTDADLATTGAKTKRLTGTDSAGNQTTVACPYLIGYRFLGFHEPIPQANYKRGSSIPVKFRLGGADGLTISNLEAETLLSPACLVRITLDGAVVGCPTYNAVSKSFHFDLKTPKNLAPGAHTVGIVITDRGTGDVLNRNLTTVIVKS